MYLNLFLFCVVTCCITGIQFAKTDNNTSEEEVAFVNKKRNTDILVKKTSTVDLVDLVELTNTNEIYQANNTFATSHVEPNLNKSRLKRRKKRRRKIRPRTRQTEIQSTDILDTKNSSVHLDRILKRRKQRKRKRKHQKIQDNQAGVKYLTTGNLTDETNLDLQVNNSIMDVNKYLTNNFKTDMSNKLPLLKSNSITPTVISKKRNRCIINNGGCSHICKPRGKNKCFCLKGYALAKNRKKCVDVNECRKRNGGCQEMCQNTLGSYYCDCTPGYRISDDSKTCQDINECHLRNGHGPCQDTCENTPGSYRCSCSHLNGTRLGKNKHSCETINNCEEMNPGCSHFCINTRVGGFCSCPEGMELMSDYKTCQDIDECEDISMNSPCLRGCVNTIGSFYCEEDYQNDFVVNKTKVPSCPPLDVPPFGFIECLRNSSLPYDSFTKNGRRIIKNSPGTKCHLECPIGFRLLGGGRYICGTSGKWITKKKGICIKSPYPKLECPPDQTFNLPKEKEKIFIRIPPPQTNIRWKIVNSYPKWAKSLQGELSEGHHTIQFSVTDPASKLSSICSFSIIVKH